MFKKFNFCGHVLFPPWAEEWGERHFVDNLSHVGGSNHCGSDGSGSPVLLCKAKPVM